MKAALADVAGIKQVFTRISMQRAILFGRDGKLTIKDVIDALPESDLEATGYQSNSSFERQACRAGALSRKLSIPTKRPKLTRTKVGCGLRRKCEVRNVFGGS